MAVKYIKFKDRKFALQKDAITWAKKEKKDMRGQMIKIETNYLDALGMWEAVLYMKAT